ncbi:MAG: nucleotidyltransferase family protein [bacterium]
MNVGLTAFVLAAGKGSRLASCSGDLPKPLVDVGGAPVLEWILTDLGRQNISNVIMNVSWQADQITQFCGDGRRFGCRILYSHEKELLGTAGGVKKMESVLSDPFVVVYGDTLREIDYMRLVRKFQEKHADLVIALHRVEAASQSGVVDLDPDSRVVGFAEKPERVKDGSLGNAGVYVMSKRCLLHLVDGRPADFSYDVFPQLLADSARIYGDEVDGMVLDIGTPDRLRQAREMWPPAPLKP